MEIQQERPPAYSSHKPADLAFPAVPTHGFGKAQEITLPSLKTVISPTYQQQNDSPLPSNLSGIGSPGSVRSLPQIDAHAPARTQRARRDSGSFGQSDAGNGLADDEHGNRTTTLLAVEDPDLRDAAEALAGLGNPDFIRSPHATNSAHVPSHANPSFTARAHENRQEPEPLLHLLTQAHPWVGGTIEGSLNAYSATKSYTPRFVQASANMVERNITNPMMNTVGSVGRMTGVESAARWYLEGRQPGNADEHTESSGRKRRRVMNNDEMDIESGITSPRTGRRRESVDSQPDSRAGSLPAYRASKPPSYREEASPATRERSQMIVRPTHNRSWSSGILHSASGLGVAMSETSRRNLTFCLDFLNRSAEHIATVANALKLVLEQYDQARDQWHEKNDKQIEAGSERPRTPDHDEAARRLAEIIKKHCEDIWQTLKTVVNRVSASAGGALPANAREFVRTQLMSLPRRWHYVSNRSSGNGETSRGAHRMVAFATEGLDMIYQVTQMCQATLDSATGWLNMVGRRYAEEAPPPPAPAPTQQHVVDEEKMITDHEEHRP